MSKSLTDLRSNKPTGRPERVVIVSLRPDLVARVQALNAELSDLLDGDQPAPSRARKMGEKSAPASAEHPRAVEIRAELEKVLEGLAQYEGSLLVRATPSDGEWRQWVDAHPARVKGEPGHDRDRRIGDGVCNTDDLINELATYAHAWNGEELGPGDWAGIFEPAIGGAQKQEVAEAVIAMYEGRLDFQQWRIALSADLKRWRDSASPASSVSPTSDSTGGSPAPSNAATTGTATG